MANQIISALKAVNLFTRYKSKKDRHILEQIKVIANLFAMPVLLLVLWQILSSTGVFLEVILPSPIKVVQGFGEIVKNGTLAIDLKISLYRVLVGYFWGSFLGLVLGVSCGLSKFMERLIGAIVDTVRQIPTMAWIPLIVLWFGIGETSKYIIIAKSVFIPIFVNTLQGIRGVSNDYIEVAEVLEIPYFKRLRKVILPSALPSIFTGVRLGAGNSFMAVVAAEMLGGISGLGFALSQSRDFLQSDRLIALMFVIGILGLLIDRIIKLAQASVLHWRKGFTGEKK